MFLLLLLFAVDIAGYYQSEEMAYNDFNGRWRAGFNFQNLNLKISYDNDDLNNNFCLQICV